MPNREQNIEGADKSLAAVCGLNCTACTLYIATREDPKRLKDLATRFQMPEGEIKCYGCRSEKRGPYCESCEMSACAADRNIDFCSECKDYPCDALKQFQSERPHRIELWDDQERINRIGYSQWLEESKSNYSCIGCKTINSAYDLACRKCGRTPSCAYVAKHGATIKRFLKSL